MLHTREEFVRAVCENPGDDTIRLVFADWLDENWEFQLAELIRLQVWHGRNWPDHPLRAKCRCRSCRAFRRCGELLTLDNRVKWGCPAYTPCCRLRWFRGFVETIEIPIAEALAEAKGIFSVHPVTAVVPVDYVFCHFQFEGRWVVRVNNTPALRTPPETRETYLPVAFKSLLTGGREYIRTYGDREYATEPDAIDALSRAFVAYGRKLAGLPPLPESPQ